MESQITNGSDRSLYGGSAIKAYSRRIGSTCLSSAEAETFSIVEAAHECRGISLMAETFWNGLPKRAPNGDFETISGKMVSNTKTAMMGTMSASAAVLHQVEYMQGAKLAVPLMIPFVYGVAPDQR
jgi:hypothetical protein